MTHIQIVDEHSPHPTCSIQLLQRRSHCAMQRQIATVRSPKATAATAIYWCGGGNKEGLQTGPAWSATMMAGIYREHNPAQDWRESGRHEGRNRGNPLTKQPTCNAKAARVPPIHCTKSKRRGNFLPSYRSRGIVRVGIAGQQHVICQCFLTKRMP